MAKTGTIRNSFTTSPPLKNIIASNIIGENIIIKDHMEQIAETTYDDRAVILTSEPVSVSLILPKK